MTRIAVKIAPHNAMSRWNRHEGRPDPALEEVIGWESGHFTLSVSTLPVRLGKSTVNALIEAFDGRPREEARRVIEAPRVEDKHGAAQ